MRSRSSKRNDRASAPSSKAHRVDRYAAAVLAGELVAGPYVRLACERHQRDRARQAWAYSFDEARADHAINFFETVLKLPDMLDEDGYSMPFLLQPWQAFIVGSLFGWVDDQGFRRFREAYIEVGKGNGKTPLCAGMGLYGLVMDGERAAEIYAAAADQDQAQILFRDAVRMVEASPDLAAIVHMSGGEHIWKIDHKPSLSFFKTFSRESGSKSGTRPHMGLLDELHEQPTPQISLKIRAGAKRRKQPLFVEITNSGFDRTSICWQHHEHSRKVVEQAVPDEQWFAYVCAIDEDDDFLKDEGCWPKANPNLGISIDRTYLRAQVKNAINMPSETNTVLRLNGCVWTQADARAIDMVKWRACAPFPSAGELLGSPCYGGLDLGQSDDFCAWARLWELVDGRLAVKLRFWLPQSALEAYPDRPYAEWKRAGILTVTDGDAVDYDLVEDTIAADCKADGIREVAYDKRFAEQMAQHLIGAGITMVNTAQGFQLNEALRLVLDKIVDGTLCHGDNAILTWMASNVVVVTGRIGEKRIAKERSADKIDGFSALEMAADRIVRKPIMQTPQFRMVVLGR